MTLEAGTAVAPDRVVDDEADTDPDAAIIIDRPLAPEGTADLVITFKKPRALERVMGLTFHLPKPRTFPRATRPPTDER